MMSSYSLLFFDNPKKGKRPSISKKRLGPVLNTPVFEKQVERLGPVFNSLQDALKHHRLTPQTSTVGLEPECTIVMEIRGSLEDFISITRNTDGLEWLAEFGEEVDSDEDFYNIDETGKRLDTKIKNKLFVTMANQQAIDELIRCWNLYKEDPTVKFDKGKSKLKDIFKNLYDIRRWNTKDRLENSFLLENWQLKKEQGYTDLSLEVELWYRNDSKKQDIAEKTVVAEIEKLGGRIIQTSIIPEIRYHALLASVPASVFEKLQNNEDISLLKCEEVMYFNPEPQSLSAISTINEDECENFDKVCENNVDDECHIAVLDTLPISNHESLKGSLNINDVDNLAESTSIEGREHGTSICSLIVNGDLSKNESKLKHKIYVRPILNDLGIPNNTLPVDITFRAIQEIVNDEKLKNTIKIINFSIGDYNRQFNKNISAWARLIDYFSYEYNLLFCISTGNYEEPIELNCTLSEWNNYSIEEKNKAVLESIKNTDIHRKILSPAESINAITVGALHDDYSNFTEDINRLELTKSNFLPSLITRLGLGYRNSIKPDISVEGGRQLYERPLIENQKLVTKLKFNKTKAPGLCTAYGTNKKAYFCGTSFSCALASRAAEQFYEVLEEIAESIPSNIAALLKAMLIHCSSWNDFENYIKQTLNIEQWSKRKKFTSKLVGYGKANFSKLLSCTPQRVTALTVNKIKKDETHEYRFPLPSSLTGQRNWFRLTMTLAWFSSINCDNAKYRRAKLWIEKESDGVLSNIISDSKIELDNNSTSRGTAQHLVYENEKALAYVDGTDIVIKVSCLSEDSRVLNWINYGLVVTLEVKEDNPIDIYNEIAERIIIKEKVQTRV